MVRVGGLCCGYGEGGVRRDEEMHESVCESGGEEERRNGYSSSSCGEMVCVEGKWVVVVLALHTEEGEREREAQFDYSPVPTNKHNQCECGKRTSKVK